MGNDSKTTDGLPTMGEDIMGDMFDNEATSPEEIMRNALINLEEDIINNYSEDLNHAIAEARDGDNSMLNEMIDELEQYLLSQFDRRIKVYPPYLRVGDPTYDEIMDSLDYGENAVQILSESGEIALDVITKLD